MIRVAIVDDSELLRVGLRSTLEAEEDIEVVAEFETAGAAIAAMGKLKPDVVLMSANMPDISGFAACREMTSEDVRPRVILLISESSTQEVAAGISCGSAGYLSRSAARSDLVRVVRANGHGEMLLLGEVAELVLSMTRNGQVVTPERLSDREREVVVMVANGAGNREIATELGLSIHTIRNHVNRICTKLGLSRRVELGVYAARVGHMNDKANH
jgi:DNA-binding NarL/FixJ family response regulator